MRLLVLVVLVIGLGTASCEKYKLKQPAYLNFKWDFFNQTPGEHKAMVTEGYFYLNHFSVYGSREKGPEVQIDQGLPSGKTSFTAGGSLGLTMDIPIGDYNEFEVKLNVVDDAHPCLVIYGNYDMGFGDPIPFRVEWDAKMDLAFHPNANFTLEKKKNYNVVLGVDASKLFSEALAADWSEASVTIEEDGPTIVIRENFNQKLFLDINQQLHESLTLKVE